MFVTEAAEGGFITKAADGRSVAEASAVCRLIVELVWHAYRKDLKKNVCFLLVKWWRPCA